MCEMRFIINGFTGGGGVEVTAGTAAVVPVLVTLL